ncbi:hypothetical protein HPB47_020712 [Ixodes persulcatus]|uniref:Uncharacterized protein n=1 Tax=Ixodes persulcatus TaxID=34615 RepID=A0AC60QET9_IXOPE|nr:hypothetical protein HPB47_020712 [Ixodes persulcatus]
MDREARHLLESFSLSEESPYSVQRSTDHIVYPERTAGQDAKPWRSARSLHARTEEPRGAGGFRELLVEARHGGLEPERERPLSKRFAGTTETEHTTFRFSLRWTAVDV